MEGFNRLYVLGCVASVFAPVMAFIEWSSHWMSFQSYSLRVLFCLPLSIPFVLATWFVTSAATLLTVAIFRQSWLGHIVELGISFSPWAVALLTCQDHMGDALSHYGIALGLTAGCYALESVSWAKSRGSHVSSGI